METFRTHRVASSLDKVNMKLNAIIEDCEFALDIKREGEGNDIIIAEVDNRRYELKLHEQAGTQTANQVTTDLLMHGNQVFDCYADTRDARHSGAIEVGVGSQTFNVTINDPKRIGSASAAGQAAAGQAIIKANMPGRIARVVAEAGAKVEAGDGIIVVEAMKMQNELKTPKAGIVIEIKVTEGATVNAGDVLAIIE